MSRPLPLTERQVTALCRGAAKAGHVAIVEISKTGETVVRLIPKGNAQDRPIDMNDNADLDAELAAFEAKHGHG